MKNYKVTEINYQPNKGETFKCELCNFRTNTVVKINAHIKGHTHLNIPLPKPPGSKQAGFHYLSSVHICLLVHWDIHKILYIVWLLYTPEPN